MAKSIIDITTDYEAFSRQYRTYLQRISDPDYSEERFAWYRPEKVTDTTDPKQTTNPFPTGELKKAAQSLMQNASLAACNAGDYALLMAQHDLLVSANLSVRQVRGGQ